MTETKGKIIPFPGTSLNNADTSVSSADINRARWFKITVAPEDLIRDKDQIVRTVGAFIDAQMPFEMIAHACQELGFKVERGELDAPIQSADSNKLRQKEGLLEGEKEVMAWHYRGERVTLATQLPAPNFGSSELVIGSNPNQIVTTPNQQSADVVEGIGVYEENVNQFPDSQNTELANNPYLMTPPQIKKAA